MTQYQMSSPINPQKFNIASPKSSHLDFPLQIKEKLNEAEKLLNRSPRSRDPHL